DPLPGSPAEQLFSSEFLSECRQVLTPGGVLALQCGSLVFQPDEVAVMHRRIAEVFRHVTLHHAVVPSYQLTSFGFLHASDQPPPDAAALAASFQRVSGESKYLSEATYHSSQVLPPYLEYLRA